ncbi:hypothetical protein M422DRAFT_70408 [Sphaerobolus stellatus SS14]|uniref:FAD-binding PCMH-type domain-containing protein n=1 Tax=Sphaerobolus stellatus (strain SS14) TaxID=990650 RepID=A0A0C9TSX6_SPHS4|nr:hypothetical protein M422DRAFT_70408 [Sphaerobolus stellatus SS14]
MSRFTEVTYNDKEETASIGSGLKWEQVYAELEEFNVTVVGGRVTDVGVSGFTLGGYFPKTNQFGLILDTVVAYELVKPDGQLVNVSGTENADLFFRLKGGYNNIGIVTKLTLKVFPQKHLVWGGTITVDDTQAAQFITETAKFSTEVTDPKAGAIFSHFLIKGSLVFAPELFYDGPIPPPGIFDGVLSIPDQVSSDIFYSVSIENANTPTFEAIVNETIFWSKELAQKGVFLVNYAAELFLPTIFEHATSPRAYPPIRKPPILPFNILLPVNR